MSNNKGIPTIGVRGIQFRSRIEAQWAYIFEKLEWNWEYEPIDLEGQQNLKKIKEKILDIEKDMKKGYVDN